VSKLIECSTKIVEMPNNYKLMIQSIFLLFVFIRDGLHTSIGIYSLLIGKSCESFCTDSTLVLFSHKESDKTKYKKRNNAGYLCLQFLLQDRSLYENWKFIPTTGSIFWYALANRQDV